MEGHVWLIGMMGSGKSSVGRVLARRQGRSHYDTDDEVVRRTGCSIAQLWGQQGEAAFRMMEAAAIARLADEEPAVISTGGGAVLDPANVATMRESGQVVWLNAPVATLAARVGDGTGRPLLDTVTGEERLAEILEARRHIYTEAADSVVATNGLTPKATARRIEELWKES